MMRRQRFGSPPCLVPAWLRTMNKDPDTVARPVAGERTAWWSWAHGGRCGVRLDGGPGSDPAHSLRQSSRRCEARRGGRAADPFNLDAAHSNRGPRWARPSSSHCELLYTPTRLYTRARFQVSCGTERRSRVEEEARTQRNLVVSLCAVLHACGVRVFRGSRCEVNVRGK
ncbi:hypothetical protein MTO96_011612 [Rhipicephalus appendiculatus]